MRCIIFWVAFLVSLSFSYFREYLESVLQRFFKNFFVYLRNRMKFRESIVNGLSL
jgi:hypothetical protein